MRAGCLGTHGAHSSPAGTNKEDPSLPHRVGKGCIFGEETVARVDRVAAAGYCRRDDAVPAEIGCLGRWRSDWYGSVGKRDVQGGGVCFRVDGYGGNPQFLASANNTHGDFATVGDENSLEHGLPVYEL